MKRDSSSPVGSSRNVDKWIICNSDRIDIHLAVDRIVAERYESISFDIENFDLVLWPGVNIHLVVAQNRMIV